MRVSAPDNVKITCCFHVTPYAGHGTFFTAINYAYEELGKLICFVIELSKFHFFCSFALSIAWQSSDLPFSVLNRANIKISLLLFLNPLAYRRAYFLCDQLGKRQTPLLLFLRLIFSTSTLAFSHQTLIHSTQFPLFQQQISFPLHAFAEGYNKGLTRVL